MYWVIQDNIFGEPGFGRLISTLERLEIPHSVHKVVPGFGGPPSLEPECNPPDGPVIVMGSYTMADIAKNRGWLPGSFIGPNLNALEQLQNWGLMLNADMTVSRFECVPFRKEPFFIRPLIDSKSFSGMVVDWEQYQIILNEIRYKDDPRYIALSENTLVVSAPKKEIYMEYRLWVVDRKVVTWSRYKIGTIKQYSANVDQAIIDFGQMMVDKWAPLDCFVLDIADTPLGLRIVEVNCLNASGYYEADMMKLVMALEEYGNGTF